MLRVNLQTIKAQQYYLSSMIYQAPVPTKGMLIQK